jgi:mannose-6-phosphate isomerase-like protein (cupin superfamily)
MDFDAFADRMKKLGFDQVVKRVWKSLTTVEQHSHPFDSSAIVVQGEMWLTVDGRTEHLLPGGTFELRAHQPHSERYGAEGATYWVARRNGGARRA